MEHKVTIAGAAALFCLLASSVWAQSGIEFEKMPVGCRWLRELSNGGHWIEEYVGKKGASYIIRATNADRPGELVSTTEFNVDGHRTKLTWANGSWSKFQPFSCFALVGKCTYLFTNSDGAKQTIDSVVKLRGDILTTTSKARNGDAPFPEEKTKLGPFQIWISNNSSNYSTKVTKFENCGLIGQS